MYIPRRKPTQRLHGWTSIAVGGRVLVEIYRGDLEAVRSRLDRWYAQKLPNQFGLPSVAFAEAELFAARGLFDDASALATRLWTEAISLGHTGWALAHAVELLHRHAREGHGSGT